MSRHRFSIFLMITSLVLLAAFLFLFLKKSYRDKVEALQKETGYLFVNSVRGVEGEIFEKLLFDIKDEFPDTSGHITKIHKRSWIGHPNNSIPDSSLVVAILDDENQRFASDTTFEISIQSAEAPEKLSEIKGSLSVMIAMDGIEESTDSVFRRKKMENVLSRLDEDFTKNMRLAALPVDYKVVKIESDSSGFFNLLASGTYIDMASGEKYGVQLSGFNNYVFKQVIPEILFSLGLFSCVSLAFFTVFKNLQTQRKLTELKNDFIQNVTHELKTPIATVSVAIEAMQDFEAMNNPLRTKEYLEISKNELNRLSLLVDKVLRMSLFEKTEPELKLESIDLKALVDKILNSMKIQFEKKNAHVTPKFTGTSFSLQGDAMHLTSVIYNLLDNALKYSKESPEIELYLADEDDHLILKIKDTGIGIPTDLQAKVFDKFFRVPSGDLHNVKGHGLGLSYVDSVIKKHGGSIIVSSEPGIGSEFIISLPKEKV